MSAISSNTTSRRRAGECGRGRRVDGEPRQHDQRDTDADRPAADQDHQCGADLAADEPVGRHLGEQHVEEHGAGPADQSSAGDDRKVVGDDRRQAAGNHQRHADDRDAFVAEILSEQAAGVRDRDPGQEIEPDQPSEPRVVDPEIGHDERGQRRHRLELEAHRGPCQEQDRENQPSLAAVREMAMGGPHRWGLPRALADSAFGRDHARIMR
jgi:hypothetical protein